MENIVYSDLSYKLTKELNKDIKKQNGIFFTPPKTISNNLEILKPYLKNIKTVLEPSCGSCEFINFLNKYEQLEITGIEFNKTIYNSIKNIFSKTNKINIINDDYIKFNNKQKYDLIIGNPPYYVLKNKNIDKLYSKFFTGRPNIFILFIIKSLNILNNNGILSFILPKNFLNCLYYDKTRNYIFNNFKIIDIVECNDNYIETKQETIILIIQNINNTNKNNKYVFNINNYSIFGTINNIKQIKNLYKNSTTLYNLDFEVKVGNIVWNQCKDILTDDKDKTLLIYSSDITSNKLKIKKYKNIDKKNYINKPGFTSPLLIINRGYGIGNYKFNYYLINLKIPYLIENHLIYIKYKNKIKNNDLLNLYHKIIKSLNNDKTKEFINLYFHNNAINTIELCYLLPIYDI